MMACANGSYRPSAEEKKNEMSGTGQPVLETRRYF